MISDKLLKFYINGDWVTPLGTDRAGVENPATEDIIAEVALGSEADADRAILAADIELPADPDERVASEQPRPTAKGGTSGGPEAGRDVAVQQV